MRYNVFAIDGQDGEKRWLAGFVDYEDALQYLGSKRPKFEARWLLLVVHGDIEGSVVKGCDL